MKKRYLLPLLAFASSAYSAQFLNVYQINSSENTANEITLDNFKQHKPELLVSGEVINGKAWVEFKDKHIKYVKEFKDGNLVTDNIHDSLVVLYKTDGKTQDFKFTHTKVGDIEQERTDGGVTQKPVYSVNNKSYSTNKPTNGFVVSDKGEIFVVSLENKQ
jgi:hypothetical protein